MSDSADPSGSGSEGSAAASGGSDFSGGGGGSESSSGNFDAGGPGSGGAGSGGAGPNNQGPGLLSSEDMLARGRALGLASVPLQVSNLFDSLAQLRARASGSTAEIFPAIIGQLSQLRHQYSGASAAIAKRLGFAGGGQTTREQGKALGTATTQYGGLITGDQQTSFANLINTLSGLKPGLSGEARDPNVSTSSSFKPADLSMQGAGLASLATTAKSIVDFYKRPTPQTPGVQPYPNLPAASEEPLWGSNL